MPSGAKKRKAAKKKKENQNQSNNHSDSAPAPAHAHGEDDRESDVGEVSSPMSQEHQKLPMEGGDEKIEKDSEVSEKEIKIEDELGKKDGIIDHDDEANRASYDGGSSGSSGGSNSSSSDDESPGIKKGQAESIIASVGSVEVAEGGDLVVEALHVVESTLKQNGKKKCCSVKERISTSEPSVNEANAQSAESTPTTLDQKACVTATQENDERSTSPYIASTAAVDNGAQHVKDSVVTELVAAPSPYPIQKTSWKGCCGLFEVFSSSAA